MIVSLAVEYGYVFLTAVLISLECFLFGYIFPRKTRQKLFNQGFMEQFQDEHYQEIEQDIPLQSSGQPDNGCGRYASKLSYAEWLQLNNSRRIHYTFIESISTNITLLMIGGIYHPCLATILGFGILIGRIVYAFGFYISGSSGRLLGVLVLDISVSGLFVLSVITSIQFIQGESIHQI